MKLFLAGLVAVCALAAIAGWAIVTRGGHAARQRVYTVAAARAMLTRSPEVWVGRTLYVRGRLDGCAPLPANCPYWQPRLFDPLHPSARAALPVELVPFTNARLATLRRIPLLGAFAPAPQAWHWGVVATYRIRLHALIATPCSTGTCGGSTDLDVFACDANACYKADLLVGDP